jgi:hypothetical protein
LTPLRSMGLIHYDLYKKTYKLADGLRPNLVKISDMWSMELEKKPVSVKFAE